MQFTQDGRPRVVSESQALDQDFEVPPPHPDHCWRVIIDTGQTSPLDFVASEKAPKVAGGLIRVVNRGLVVLKEIPIIS